MEVLRGIDHPHVVRAHRYFEDADGAHLVMDLGIGSLDTVVTDSRTLFRHLRQIADALMTLHARAGSIATSSRRTSCWWGAMPCSPTSGSRSST
ncbi:MAG: protein kinase family protein [Alphaproteobacteria bacterium]|nr:protein kinase family protein [Alphaproteobacteria bacterium]